jgi:rubrerythrin
MAGKTAVHPELGAIEVQGMTRSAFILRGALAAGAMYGAGAVTPFVSNALAQATTGDVQVVTFAYGLEALEQAFYQAAAKANLSPPLKKLATEFGAHEAEHADTLKATIEQLGGSASAGATPKFNVTDDASFLKTAVALEDTGVAAYNGAIPSLQSPDLVAALATIVQTEARHAAAVRVKSGQDAAPQAFEKPLTQQQAAAALKPYTG